MSMGWPLCCSQKPQTAWGLCPGWPWGHLPLLSVPLGASGSLNRVVFIPEVLVLLRSGAGLCYMPPGCPVGRRMSLHTCEPPCPACAGEGRHGETGLFLSRRTRGSGNSEEGLDSRAVVPPSALLAGACQGGGAEEDPHYREGGRGEREGARWSKAHWAGQVTVGTKASP